MKKMHLVQLFTRVKRTSAFPGDHHCPRVQKCALCASLSVTKQQNDANVED